MDLSGGEEGLGAEVGGGREVDLMEDFRHERDVLLINLLHFDAIDAEG